MTWWRDGYLGTGAALGVVAFVVVLILVVAPRSPVVPRNRRRPVDDPGDTAVGGIAKRLTAGVDRALTSRDSHLAERLDVAGIRLPASNLVVLTGSGMIVGFALGLLLGLPLLSFALLALIPIGVMLTIRVMTDRRRAAFAGQLDETAQMLAGSLRSGYSFTQALATVGKEAVSPTGEEFVRITNELRLGRPIADSMENTARRMKSEDFSWIGQAVAINREVGGNLADVLEGVSHTIRERAQLRRQVQSLSSEGRLSALVLIGLPFVLAGVFAVVNPKYIGLLFTRLLGWVMLGMAAILLTIGSLWLRVAVRIKY
ncbi:type II secretion system F family protein [Aestuariimicrobium kwangyangense]|uniref:type II secretion system F family protein n=1 Tax=Aestuariimicrobium kwangyangense TaxID=396389 RepID=UPI0003B4B52E|nr:type II secretion system F family protein [Aestuariimicrobium kwangyangense]